MTTRTHVFVVSPIFFSSEIPDSYPTLGWGQFLLYPSQFIVHQVISFSAILPVILTTSINKYINKWKPGQHCPYIDKAMNDVLGIVFRFPTRARDLCLSPSVLTGSRALSAPYCLVSLCFSPVVSYTCLEVHHSLQSNVKVKNGCILCVLSSIRLNDLHMNNFVFYVNKYRHQSNISVEAIVPQRTPVATLRYCGRNWTFLILMRGIISPEYDEMLLESFGLRSSWNAAGELKRST